VDRILDLPTLRIYLLAVESQCCHPPWMAAYFRWMIKILPVGRVPGSHSGTPLLARFLRFSFEVLGVALKEVSGSVRRHPNRCKEAAL